MTAAAAMLMGLNANASAGGQSQIRTPPFTLTDTVRQFTDVLESCFTGLLADEPSQFALTGLPRATPGTSYA